MQAFEEFQIFGFHFLALLLDIFITFAGFYVALTAFYLFYAILGIAIPVIVPNFLRINISTRLRL